MRPYALIDLHCDTLTDCMYAGANIIDTLDDPARTLSLTSIPKDIHWAQFFAVFVPDELRGEKAIRFLMTPARISTARCENSQIVCRPAAMLPIWSARGRRGRPRPF